MLEQIFGSQTRLSLLRLFFNNPSRFYYVRELTRILDAQINSVRRELEILEEVGLVKLVEGLTGDDDATKKFYQINSDSFLYNELRALILKEQLVFEQNFAEKIKSLGNNIYFLFFTGKFINQGGNLPTDLLIVGETSSDKIKIFIADFERNLRREINFTILDVREFIYRKNINDRFLKQVLESGGIVALDRLTEVQAREYQN